MVGGGGGGGGARPDKKEDMVREVPLWSFSSSSKKDEVSVVS
jgi:hypothetical protein